MFGENEVNCWDVVKAIVEDRGRTLVRYHYFEKLWSVLEDNQLIFLQAPTGAGKTEAVLAPFLKNLIEGRRKWHSLIYVLPTRSLVFNMFSRFCKSIQVCRQVFGEPKFVVVDFDHGGFVPVKAFIEGDVTVTTFDAFLYTIYGFRSYGHHLLLSLGKLAGSLVILDEVQLLQDGYWYALSLLPYHISNLLSFGATVIVMTATLPEILLEDTVRSLKLLRLPIKHYSLVKADPNEDPIKRGSLEVTSAAGFLLENVEQIAETYEKPMLLIFNTVERAVEAYLKLRGCYNVDLLHSRIVYQEREKRESRFEKEFSEDLIVVSTQVVEAGIDYDFRTLASEISPMDSLIQRLGRCARRRDGKAIIYTDLEQAKGVYPVSIVANTLHHIDAKALSDSVRDVLIASKLVNEVYTRETSEALKQEVSEDIMGSLSFIKAFPGFLMYAERSLLRTQASHLIRLGVEIRCVYLPADLYGCILDQIKSKDQISLEVDLKDYNLGSLFKDGSFSISLMKLARDTKIPSLEHRINDKVYYLSAALYKPEDEKPTIRVLEVNRYDTLYSALESVKRGFRGGFSQPLVVNPAYYEIIDGYHLGLVRPYGAR